MGGVSRRWLAAAAGAAVAGVAVVAALLFVGPLSGSGENVPDSVRQALERLGAGDGAKLVTDRVTSKGTVKLWAASSSDGVRCYVIEFVEAARGEGACPSRADAGAALFLNRSVTHLREDLHLLHGEVRDGVTAIVLGFADGRRQRVATVDGFVLHEITASEPGFVIAVDEDAGPVGLVGSRGPSRVPFGGFFGARTAARFRTSSGRRAALTLAVGGRGTHCRQLELPGAETIRCVPQLARGLSVSRTYLGPLSRASVFVHGLVGPDVYGVRVRFRGGRSVPVRFIAGAFLYEVRPGAEAEAVVGLDRRGRVVAEAAL